MTEQHEIDAERAALITRNIHLAFEMLHELLETPALIDQLPNEATVFVAPPDDPEYARRQGERARSYARNGCRSIVWRLGADDGHPRAIPVSETTPEPAAATGANAA